MAYNLNEVGIYTIKFNWKVRDHIYHVLIWNMKLKAANFSFVYSQLFYKPTSLIIK